jgi:hypothetical protein
MHTFGEIKETVEAPRYPLSGNGHPGSPHHPDTLIFMVYHMFNATVTKGNDRTNAKSKKTFKNPSTSTLKAEKANKGHENSIDPELGQKGQHG